MTLAGLDARHGDHEEALEFIREEKSGVRAFEQSRHIGSHKPKGCFVRFRALQLLRGLMAVLSASIPHNTPGGSLPLERPVSKAGVRIRQMEYSIKTKLFKDAPCRLFLR